jgi:ribosomal protein S18 acetylase RimI-like enzyme
MADDPGPRLVLESSIRRATDPDLPALAEVHRASILEIAPAFYPPEVIAYWGRERDPEEYGRGMAEHGDAIFVAEAPHRSGMFLGFSHYRFHEGRHYLKGLFVRGAAARRGIGTRLLRAAEDFARAAGATELYVEGSLSGEAFYKARGFTELSRHKHAMGRSEVDAIVMRKKL